MMKRCLFTILNLFKKPREKEGSMEDILATSVVLFVILFVVISMFHFITIMEVKRNVDAYARDYILILEENGTLKTSQVTSLKNSVASIGTVSGVNRFQKDNVEVVFNACDDGTVNQKQDYGEEVNLTVILHTNYKELGLTKIDGIIQENYDIAVSVYSTSKT